MDYKELAIKKLTDGGFTRSKGLIDFDNLVNAFDDVANKKHIGLMLIGCVGCGKTLAIKAMTPQSIFIDLADVGSLEVLQKHTRFIEGEAVEKWWLIEGNTSVILDDLGNEQMQNDYGVKTEVVSNFIMKWYSDVFKNENKKSRLHITTNLDRAQLKERYGDRVVDRLLEMVSPFFFTNTSNRTMAKVYGACK